MDNSRNTLQDERNHAVHSCSMKDEFQKANDKGQDSPGATMAIITIKGLSLGEDMAVVSLSSSVFTRSNKSRPCTSTTQNPPQLSWAAKH